MADVEARLRAIAEAGDQKQRLEQYRALLSALLASPAVEALNAFVDHSARFCSLARLCLLSLMLCFSSLYLSKSAGYDRPGRDEERAATQTCAHRPQDQTRPSPAATKTRLPPRALHPQPHTPHYHTHTHQNTLLPLPPPQNTILQCSRTTCSSSSAGRCCSSSPQRWASCPPTSTSRWRASELFDLN